MKRSAFLRILAAGGAAALCGGAFANLFRNGKSSPAAAENAAPVPAESAEARKKAADAAREARNLRSKRTYLWGKVRVVGADEPAHVRVSVVEAGEDLRVYLCGLRSFADENGGRSFKEPNSDGEWEIVDEGEDFTVHFCERGDVKIRFVRFIDEGGWERERLRA